jgi:5-methylcytosine-specific restriction endonuclease McrA
MNNTLRHKVIFRDKGYCQYCGFDHAMSYAAYAAHEIDHVTIPRGVPGCDALNNLALSCSGCNKILSGTHKRGLTLDTLQKRKDYITKCMQEDKATWFPDVQAEILKQRKKPEMR